MGFSLRSFFAFACCLFLLSSCLGKMEQETEETKDQVAATNQKLDETKNGQLVLDAIRTMSDSRESPNNREASAEVFFLMAPEIVLAQYLGAPLPAGMATASLTISGAAVELPNVTLVGEKVAWDDDVAPVNQDLYDVMSFAAYKLLERLSLKSQSALNQADLAQLKTEVSRMILVAPTVLGAMPITDLDKLAAGASSRSFVLDAGKRSKAAALLANLGTTLQLGQDGARRIRILSEAKLE